MTSIRESLRLHDVRKRSVGLSLAESSVMGATGFGLGSSGERFRFPVAADAFRVRSRPSVRKQRCHIGFATGQPPKHVVQVRPQVEVVTMSTRGDRVHASGRGGRAAEETAVIHPQMRVGRASFGRARIAGCLRGD